LFFQADNDEIERKKISYVVILVTSWPLCHRKTSPNQNFWLYQWSKWYNRFKNDII